MMMMTIIIIVIITIIITILSSLAFQAGPRSRRQRPRSCREQQQTVKWSEG